MIMWLSDHELPGLIDDYDLGPSFANAELVTLAYIARSGLHSDSSSQFPLSFAPFPYPPHLFPVPFLLPLPSLCQC